MLRQKRSRILFVLLIVMVAAASWSGWVARRQSTLDRALITAVSNGEVATTAVLLAKGADANAKDWQQREAYGWLYRAQNIRTGHLYEANPTPVLAIARVMVAESVNVEIEFAPTKMKPSWPIVWSSCVVGTVQSVDVKRKIVRIRLNVQDWHILDTG